MNSGARGSTVRAAFPLYIECPTKNLGDDDPVAKIEKRSNLYTFLTQNSIFQELVQQYFANIYTHNIRWVCKEIAYQAEIKRS